MKKYYIHTNNEQQGPFDLDELKWKGISKDTPIWYEGLPDWTTAGNADELKPLFQTEQLISEEAEIQDEDIPQEEQQAASFDYYAQEVLPPSKKIHPKTEIDTPKNYTTLILLYVGIFLLVVIDGIISGYQKTHPVNNYNVYDERLVTRVADSIRIVAENQANAIYPKDLNEQNKAIEHLTTGTRQQKDSEIDRITSFPGFYNPRVLFTMSDELYATNRKSKASFWYYLAVLRTMYDVNRSADSSSYKVYDQLTATYGKQIAPYSIKYRDSLQSTIAHVLQDAKDLPENYDPKWINVYGMDSATADSVVHNYSLQLSKSPSEWIAIKDSTIKKFIAKYNYKPTPLGDSGR